MYKITYKLKAIIFDMDGVITNTMPDHYRAWKTVLSRESIPVTRRDVYRCEGQPGDQFLIYLLKRINPTVSRPQVKDILKKKEECFKRIVVVFPELTVADIG